MTIVNEMEDFLNYNNMKKVEFYEFLGRFAELTYEENIPLVRKIERLLGVLMSQTSQSEVNVPDLEKDIDSESDYDDDLVENLKCEILNKL